MMARERSVVVHEAGPPDVSGEEVEGAGDTRLWFDGRVVTVVLGRRNLEARVPAGGVAAVEVSAAPAKIGGRGTLRLNLYDGEAYELEFKPDQSRTVLRFMYALSAAGVTVTEVAQQQRGGGGFAFFVSG